MKSGKTENSKKNKNENYILKAEKKSCLITGDRFDMKENKGDYLKRIFPLEKATYLEIPRNVTLATLKEDIRKGAVHFKELQELLEKDKENEASKADNKAGIIVVNCNNEEQGLLAVSYLEACYVSSEQGEDKEDYEADSYGFGSDTEGFESDPEAFGSDTEDFDHYTGYYGPDMMDFEPDMEDFESNRPVNGKLEVWNENPYQLPVLMLKNVMNLCNNYNGNSLSPFVEEELPFVARQEEYFRDKNYWEELNEESVCLCCNHWDLMGLNMSDMSRLDNLNLFSSCKRIYIVCDLSGSPCENDNASEVFSEPKGYCNPALNLVLQLTAEEVTVRLPKEKKERYYAHVFREMAARNGAVLANGFPLNRIIKAILSSENKNVAYVIDKVIKYALKDYAPKKIIDNTLTGKENRKVFTAKDFDFLSRYGGVYLSDRKTGKKSKAFDRMNKELIGLEEVKKQVLSVVSFIKYNRMRKRSGLNNGMYHNVHLMLGAPGTAKTTVAKFMGEIMKEEKLLKGDRFIYVNGAELKAKFVGHTAPKVKAIFEENDIIVIDEAYSLVDEKGEGDPFSREAISQLIIELEEHSTDKLVIFAGYGGFKVSAEDNRMKKFLDSNPGIRSRITSTIYFPSYSADEMTQIFAKIAQLQNYCLEEGYQEHLKNYFEKRIHDRNFGNGREARSLLENCALAAATRLFSKDKKNYSKRELQMITVKDICSALEQAVNAHNVREGNSSRKVLGFM